MKLLSTTISHFKTLRGTRVQEFPDGITVISGANGRGKSTVANAIAWCLFGPDALQTTKADVITWGEEECIVRLSIEIDDQEYDIYRQQKNDVSNAELRSPDAKLIARGIDPVNREVQRILGVDRVAFLSMVYARQEELSGLMSLTPANRVNTVLRLRGVDRLSAATDSVRAQSRDARKVLDGMRAGYSDPAELQGLISDLMTRIGVVEGGKEHAISELTAIEAELHDLLDKQQQLQPRREAYERYREQRLQAALALGPVQDAVDEAREKLRHHSHKEIDPGPQPPNIDTDTIERARSEVNLVQHRLAELRATRQQTEKHTKCQACGRPFAHANDAADMIKAITEEIESLTDLEESLDAEYNLGKNAKIKFDAWKERSELSLATKEEQKRLRQTVTKAENALNAAFARRDAIPVAEDVSRAAQRLSEHIAQAGKRAAQIRETLATLAERENGLRDRLGDATILLERANFLRGEIGAQEEIAHHLEVTAGELSRFKAQVIGESVPTLEARAGQLLNKLTDGRFNELHLTDTYEVQYRNDQGEFKTFENLSGGEKDVFALALRLALADLRADQIGILILDEIFESLDVDRQESVWQTIEHMSNRYSQILLMTHIQSFKDRATQVIQL